MKIQIKEPCHKDWNKMKIGMISRHCDSCKKDVFDFTQKSRAEIILHLLSNPNENVCGRMREDQFDFQHEDIPILVEVLKTRPTNSSFLILTLVCLSLVACTSENSTIQPKKDLPVIVDADTIQRQWMGEVALPPVKTDRKPAPELGKVKIDVKNVLQGDVCIVAPEPPSRPMVAGGISYQPIEVSPRKFAEKMPEFDGGMNAMFEFIGNNLKYPLQEKEDGVQGTVYAKIVINTDGSVSNSEIVRSVTGHPSFDMEVLRVLNVMPNWIPAENNGVKVAVEYTVPFRFKLD